MNILHLEKDQYPSQDLEKLESIGHVEYIEYTDKKSFLEFLKGKSFEVLFVKLGLSVDKELVEALPNLQFVITPTTGLTHIDEDLLKEKQITLISLKGEIDFLSTVKSTAEHTWALMLALCRRIPAAQQSVINGKWIRNPFLGTELNGLTLGVIGYGRLGKMVVEFAKAFAMNVLVNDTSGKAFSHSNFQNTTLKYILHSSDIISLHIPFSEENKNFFDKEKINDLKPGVLFINTSRGELVDETALLEGVKNGQIGGAALDVLVNDSSWEGTVPENHALVLEASKRDNLILSPHIGGYGKKSIEQTREFIVKKFLRVLKQTNSVVKEGT